MIGADATALEGLGFEHVVNMCGTRPAWEFDHRVESYRGGWSSMDAGEVTLFVSVADGLVKSVMVLGSDAPLGLLRATEEQCRQAENWTNEDGVDVAARHCSSAVFLEHRVYAYEENAPPPSTCDSAEGLLDVWRTVSGAWDRRPSL